jgi:predicted nucleic acid-binding protein
MSEKVIFDTNFFTYFSDSQGSFSFVPDDSNDTLEDRFDFLLENLQESYSKIIIPAPVLAEVLAARNSNEETILEIISGQSNFIFSDFDTRQSIEFGIVFKNYSRGAENRNSFKFDMLILACAKIEGASTIYTADEGLKKKAQKMGMKAINFQELAKRPAPPAPANDTIDLFG